MGIETNLFSLQANFAYLGVLTVQVNLTQTRLTQMLVYIDFRTWTQAFVVEVDMDVDQVGMDFSVRVCLNMVSYPNKIVYDFR